MRELAISQELVDQVAAMVEEEGALRATQVTVEIGPLANVDADVLRAALELAAKDSVAEGADWELVEGAMVVQCQWCGAERETTGHSLICPACGSNHTTLTSGREVVVTELSLEEGEYDDEEEDEEEDDPLGEEE